MKSPSSATQHRGAGHAPQVLRDGAYPSGCMPGEPDSSVQGLAAGEEEEGPTNLAAKGRVCLRANECPKGASSVLSCHSPCLPPASQQRWHTLPGLGWMGQEPVSWHKAGRLSTGTLCRSVPHGHHLKGAVTPNTQPSGTPHQRASPSTAAAPPGQRNYCPAPQSGMPAEMLDSAGKKRCLWLSQPGLPCVLDLHKMQK